MNPYKTNKNKDEPNFGFNAEIAPDFTSRN